jgi:hypothetical protein
MLQIWYDIAEFLLPFEWIEHNFMKNALLAVLLITPLFGLLGTMVVSNKMAFFSDSIGHGAFTGIAIGALFGGLQPLLGAVLFSVVFAIVITVIKDKSRTSTDTIIGVFSSTAVAVGLILLSSGGFNKYSSYLVGDLLSIRPRELLLLLISFVAVIALWVLIFNKVLMISINQSLAASRGRFHCRSGDHYDPVGRTPYYKLADRAAGGSFPQYHHKHASVSFRVCFDIDVFRHFRSNSIILSGHSDRCYHRAYCRFRLFCVFLPAQEVFAISKGPFQTGFHMTACMCIADGVYLLRMMFRR